MRRFRRAAVRAWLIGQKIRAKLFPPAPAPVTTGQQATPPVSLNGATVLVTGASRGIGAALALAYAQAGARVVLAARSAEKIEALAQRIVEKGQQACAIRVDLSRSDEVSRLFHLIAERFGGLDVLVNNAGATGPHGHGAFDVSAEEWTAVWQVNVEAAVRCTNAAAALARQHQRPLRVINVSSGIVGHAAPRLGPYAASKDALEAATRAFALDGEDGLASVCAIRPRSVQSELTREYYGTAIHTLLDEPEVVAPIFLWAAVAPSAAVNGRSFSEPGYAADPDAAAWLRPPFDTSPPIAMAPATFSDPALASLPGAYMHLLENAQGFSPLAAQALSQAGGSRALFAYPDPQYRTLAAAIAEETNTEPDRILVAPGSSDLIDRSLRLFCGPGDEIVMTKPTWSLFHAFVQRWQVVPKEVPMQGSLERGDLRHDLDGLLAAITPRTRLVYLVNPCNPTGSIVDPHGLEDFVRRLPPQVVAIIDEAYAQYADPERLPRLAPLLDQCAARVIVLRTFSKFFGLGGLRLGYALARPDTLRLLGRADLPFSVTTPAVIAGQAVLADHEFRQRVAETNRAGRQQLLDGLAALKLSAQPSQTNFILFDAPVEPATMRKALCREGLVLPQVDQFLRNYMLIAVGRPEHNAAVLDYLSRY